jgi:hypothetical protein
MMGEVSRAETLPRGEAQRALLISFVGGVAAPWKFQTGLVPDTYCIPDITWSAFVTTATFCNA